MRRREERKREERRDAVPEVTVRLVAAHHPVAACVLDDKHVAVRTFLAQCLHERDSGRIVHVILQSRTLVTRACVC